MGNIVKLLVILATVVYCTVSGKATCRSVNCSVKKTGRSKWCKIEPVPPSADLDIFITRKNAKAGGVKDDYVWLDGKGQIDSCFCMESNVKKQEVLCRNGVCHVPTGDDQDVIDVISADGSTPEYTVRENNIICRSCNGTIIVETVPVCVQIKCSSERSHDTKCFLGPEFKFRKITKVKEIVGNCDKFIGRDRYSFDSSGVTVTMSCSGTFKVCTAPARWIPPDFCKPPPEPTTTSTSTTTTPTTTTELTTIEKTTKMKTTAPRSTTSRSKTTTKKATAKTTSTPGHIELVTTTSDENYERSAPSFNDDTDFIAIIIVSLLLVIIISSVIVFVVIPYVKRKIGETPQEEERQTTNDTVKKKRCGDVHNPIYDTTDIVIRSDTIPGSSQSQSAA